MSKDKAVQITLFLLRVAAGLMFLQAGGNKIFDWFGGVPAEFGGHPAAWSQTWIGGVLEFYGGLLILLGLLTRPVALVLSGEMAVAYFQFHYKSEAFWPTQNGAFRRRCTRSSSCFSRPMAAATGAWTRRSGGSEWRSS